MGMSYEMSKSERYTESRMEILSEMTVSQFLSLPNGTELTLIDVAPLGLGMRIQNIGMTDVTREEMLAACAESEKTMEDKTPWSLVIYLLPENWVPDPDELLTGTFRSLGERHGREGSPMYSASMLKERHGDGWTDDSYNTYVTAYKAASARRNGR